MNLFKIKLLVICFFASLTFAGKRGTQVFAVSEPEKLKLKMSLVNGSIKVNEWNKSHVEFEFTKKKAVTSIVFKTNDNSIEVEVEDDVNDEGMPNVWSLFGDNSSDDEVDFVINMPYNAEKVKLETVNGDLQLKGNFDTVLESVNGDIYVEKDSGYARIESVNGEIGIKINKKLNEKIDLETVNGSVEIKVPSNTNADVDISTVVGEVNTDFPIGVAKKDFVSSEIKGKLANGGVMIKAETVNGLIRLLKN
ncbi:MAG: DUF4097 family beta strand repeat protein [Fibrobacteres bacterium]|nr:DUF4097 family beta strand repeat protein [Fibrobacterota bacterium]